MQLYAYIESQGSADIRELATHLYGADSRLSLQRTRGLLQNLRRKMRKEGLDIYAVGGQYKILNGADYVKFSESQKGRVDHLLNSLNAVVTNAIDNHPGYEALLMDVLQECLLKTLTIHTERKKQIATTNPELLCEQL
tara:strand:- start:138 stop:551 length:414 start_codon:yes stop_codon:yes gene_type:complete